MLDHASLLTRFVGHRVCVTLYGQNKVWGRVATVCHDSVRLTDTAVVSEHDDQEWLNQSLYEDHDEHGRPRYAETVIQLNHIVSITCLDESVPAPEDDSDLPVRLDGHPSRSEASTSRGRAYMSRRTPEAELHDTHIEAYADHFLGEDRLAIELGYGLLRLVDPEEDDDLLGRVENLRKSLAAETGLWLPPVRVRDNLRLGQHEYRILVCGQEAARGEVFPDSWFSIDPDEPWEELPSEPSGDGAKWIARDQLDDDALEGRIVVEPSAVIVGRLHAVARSHADELLSVEDVRRLLERARQGAPALVEELGAHGLPLGVLRRVIATLLSERVPLRGFLRILESLVAVHRLGARESEELIARVRVDLGRELCSPFVDERSDMPALLLEPSVEQMFWRSLRGQRIVLPQATVQAFCQKLAAHWKTARRRAPLVVDAALRRPLRDLVARAIPGLAVLACNEVPHQVGVIPAAVIRADELPSLTDESPVWATLVVRPPRPETPASPDAARFAAPERRPIFEPVAPNA